MPATKVMVHIPDEETYAVRIGSDALADLGTSLKGLTSLSSRKRLLIISDDNVAPLYLARAKEALSLAGFRVSDIIIPAGEESKSTEIAAEVWEAMARLNLGRDCFVVALGGGVVGDLAGFIASTYMRGVPIVQVPTTLLAMVDSSVGGKTAINLEAGKNLVGTFTQPVYVCASTATLSTLPEREWICGCAEIAKSSVIDSDEFFFWLLEHSEELALRDSEVVAEAIARCVVFKANVVAEDKTESRGVRECLNYGHTLGHAIEALAGYGTFSHGACVAEGMRFAARLATDLVSTSEAFVATQDELLDTLGLTRLNFAVDSKEIMAAMKNDKKVRGGAVRFVLPRDVGDWVLLNVDDEDILRQLDLFYGA